MVTERRLGVNPIEIAPILAAIPPYKDFQTGTELHEGSKALVRDYPALVTTGFISLDESFGTSTEGKPIELMTIGKGKKKIMWVGTPHSNEAVGTLAVDFFSRYLCEHPDLPERMDTTFIFIKNADPDGFELNESWLKGLDGKVDPLRYALGFYRSPFDKQPEYGFPIDYETLHVSEDQSSQETLTLKRAIDEYKPSFYYSLHNAGFHGACFWISSTRDGLYPSLQAVITDQNIPLHTGEPEEPFQEKLAAGIYQTSKVRRRYDHYRTHLEDDPARLIQSGASVSEYLEDNIPGAFSVLPEVPYFTADAFGDHTPSGISKRDALLRGAKMEHRIRSFMEEQYNVVKDHVSDNRLTNTVEMRIAHMEARNTALLKEIEQPKFQQEATNADVFQAEQMMAFYAACDLGQVYHLALQAGEVKRAEVIKQHIEGIIEDINKVSPLRAIPIQTLVAMQVATGLLVQQQ